MCIIVIYLSLVIPTLKPVARVNVKNSCDILTGRLLMQMHPFLLLKHISCKHCTFIIVIYTIIQLILSEIVKPTKNLPCKTNGNVYNNN